MASEEGCKGVIAAAVLIDAPVGRVIINFFISVSRPLRHTKIFTNEEDAKKLRSQFVKKNLKNSLDEVTKNIKLLLDNGYSIFKGCLHWDYY